MNTNKKNSSELKFSEEEIHRQLERILLNKAFTRSDILTHFLSFIVKETIHGHASWLKEYTIAVNVLHKHANFKPQENCIVRIHAGRLRRALNRYYEEKGALDPLRITIPKGSYVPVFDENRKTIADVIKSDNRITNKPVVVGVTPFNHVQSNSFEDSLANGLGLQLSTELMNVKYFSVIAYYVMRNLSGKTTDYKKINQETGVKYLLSGDIQSVKNQLRIHIQMIHTSTNKQVWSQMYERKFAPAEIFKIQDEVVKLIVPELEKLSESKNGELQSLPIMAVA